MNNKTIIRIKAVSQVVFILVILFFIISFMNIKVGKWEAEAIQQVLIVYSILTILLYITCVISLERKLNTTYFGFV